MHIEFLANVCAQYAACFILLLTAVQADSVQRILNEHSKSLDEYPLVLPLEILTSMHNPQAVTVTDLFVLVC